MKFGICIGISKLDTFAAADVDYVEVNASPIAAMTDEEFEKAAAIADKYPGLVYACNGLVPATLRLTGPDVNFDEVLAYTEKCFSRLARLGVKMIVFGSSAAKHVPDGFSHEEAMEQLIRVVHIFADVAERFGQTVVIEPLRTEECNIINTVEDALNLVKAVNRKNVHGHADFYHMMQNGEKLTKFIEQVPSLDHIHIASPIKRNIPTPDDGANYKAMIDALRAGGYDKTISFEGSGATNADIVRELMAFLRSL